MESEIIDEQKVSFADQGFKFMKKRYSKRGFTLIELLVVIAIIGLLSSVVLSSLNTARSKARDAKRLSDIGEIRKALEFYYDKNGFYPKVCGNSSAPPPPPSNAYFIGWESLKTELSPYISSLPVDPFNIDKEYGYYYCFVFRPIVSSTPYTSSPASATGDRYILATRLENSYASPNYHGSGFGLMSNPIVNYLIGEYVN